MILAEPRHEPKVRQGVTTEVIGIDGRPELKQRWSTVAEYLALFDNAVAINICYLLGNSPVRVAGVGWQDRPATPGELANMRSIVREALEEGAWGLSTGLDYPPGGYADTAELVELSEEAARLGGIYHTHVRYALGDRFLDPFREALEIGRPTRVSGCARRSRRAGCHGTRCG